MFFFDPLTHTLFFQGSKSSVRKSLEVRLGPEQAGHLPRYCGKADTGPAVIRRDNITLGTFRKHTFGVIGASGDR